jgi:uncharacterized protein (TIGR04255 family)
MQGPNVQLITSPPSLTRYWLVSVDDQELIQVQPNYLALNWRHRGEGSDYPGYEHMRDRFRDLLLAAKEGLAMQQGVFKPVRVELTYINTIHPNSLWISHRDTHKLLRGVHPASASYEQLSFSYSRALNNSEEGFFGRLHVSLNPTVDWIKREPQLILNLTARSADLAEQTVDGSLTFLDNAHSAVTDAFVSLISDDARHVWGLE